MLSNPVKMQACFVVILFVLSLVEVVVLDPGEGRSGGVKKLTFIGSTTPKRISRVMSMKQKSRPFLKRGSQSRNDASTAATIRPFSPSGADLTMPTDCPPPPSLGKAELPEASSNITSEKSWQGSTQKSGQQESVPEKHGSPLKAPPNGSSRSPSKTSRDSSVTKTTDSSTTTEVKVPPPEAIYEQSPAFRLSRWRPVRLPSNLQKPSPSVSPQPSRKPSPVPSRKPSPVPSRKTSFKSLSAAAATPPKGPLHDWREFMHSTPPNPPSTPVGGPVLGRPPRPAPSAALLAPRAVPRTHPTNVKDPLVSLYDEIQKSLLDIFDNPPIGAKFHEKLFWALEAEAELEPNVESDEDSKIFLEKFCLTSVPSDQVDLIDDISLAQRCSKICNNNYGYAFIPEKGYEYTGDLVDFFASGQIIPVTNGRVISKTEPTDIGGSHVTFACNCETSPSFINTLLIHSVDVNSFVSLKKQYPSQKVVQFLKKTFQDTDDVQFITHTNLLNNISILLQEHVVSNPYDGEHGRRVMKAFGGVSDTPAGPNYWEKMDSVLY